jgi:hypothetical protein
VVTDGDVGAPNGSFFFSYSYSYSVRHGGRYSYSKRFGTAIEYEYRFAEYEYEYDESRCDARTRFDVDQIIVAELGSYNSDGRAR